MTIHDILTDGETLMRLCCQIVSLVREAPKDNPVIERMMSNIELHERLIGHSAFKATRVFLNCVKSMSCDDTMIATLILKADLNVLRVLIQEFARCLNIEHSMDISQELVDSGGISEGVFLKDCQMLKTLHEVKEHCVRHKTIVVM